MDWSRGMGKVPLHPGPALLGPVGPHHCQTSGAFLKCENVCNNDSVMNGVLQPTKTNWII